jgi:hypothetical protein
MITPAANVNQADLSRLNRLLDFTAQHTTRNMGSLVKQSALTAIQSAAKATAPGNSASIKALPLRFKLRPLFPIYNVLPAGEKMWAGANNKTFSTSHKFSTKERVKKNIRLITKAFQFWDKKKKQWSFIPYLGSAAGKYDPNDKRGRIPGYAAAKAGWLKALAKFGKPDNTDDNLKRPVCDVQSQTTGPNPFAIITNLVDYIAKIAPNSAKIGVEKATNRLEKVLLPKLSQELQDKWRNS